MKSKKTGEDDKLTNSNEVELSLEDTSNETDNETDSINSSVDFDQYIDKTDNSGPSDVTQEPPIKARKLSGKTYS